MLLRRIPDRNIWVIYVAILLLGVAYGVSIAVLAIHLDAHKIPKLAMGGLAAAFAFLPFTSILRQRAKSKKAREKAKGH